MSDVIRLLPDSVANQIAAGEVVQRPASAVKELLENAIDAGATQVKLIVKDAGRTLIQVTDNGRGMSETDARMCFERHATSKITQASDLFAIRTMGFRGEALASIAAISRVELRTRTAEAQVGSEVIIEGSVVEIQQPCQCPRGTSIAVKNLFFNTPARRNFLKSDPVEKTHIFNELLRIALANPNVGFMYYQNGQLTHQIEAGNLKQRIVSLFGNNYNQRLVPVHENTEIVSIEGFLLKPEFARKKRNDQYFFVNNRFIRSAYLATAIELGFQELIPSDMYPSFFIYLEIDPQQIDVNVHPTKTEIKFQDENIIFQILMTTVKRSLGKYNIAPTLDFERETAFDHLLPSADKEITPPVITINPDYNPFGSPTRGQGRSADLFERIDHKGWESLYPKREDGLEEIPDKRVQTVISSAWETHEDERISRKFLQLQNKYILVPVKSGLMIIDQQRAHERILFERYVASFENMQNASQQLLFPETLNLMEYDAELLREILPEVKTLGFQLTESPRNTFVITGSPMDLPGNENLCEVLESVLENFKTNRINTQLDARTNLARSLARRFSIKQGKALDEHEMQLLTNSLFACQMPYHSPSGKPVISIMKMEDISEKFK